MSDRQSAPINDPLGAACELVGRFLYHSAGVERRIDAAIAKLFELSEAAADILTANIDFNRKLNLIETIVDDQASDKPRKWRYESSEAADQKNLARIDEIEARLLEASFDTVDDKRVGSKILLDGDSSCPRDWCDFKIKLFQRLQEFI
jgi:hypothetical protein